MSDKEELISQGAAASRKQAGMVNKALQSRASSTSPFPNLNFLDFQRKIILITEDIKKLRKSSFLMKMKNTLTSSGPSLDGKSHMDGSLLAKTSKKPGLDSIVSELSKDPTSTTSRVKLIRTLMQDQRQYNLQYYKDLMIQASLPVYLGHITPASLQVASQTYRIYLRQLIAEHKKKLLIVRSSQLKNVNIDMIPVESLIQVDPDQPIGDEEARIILETKLALKLLDFSRSLDSEIRANITMPLEMTEIEQLSPRHGAVMEFLGNKEIGSTYNKHQLIIRKAISVMDIVKHIPFLHSLGLKMADKLEEVERKMPGPFLMEGRIHMQAMKLLTLRMMMDEYTAKNALTPTFKKVVVAYRKALKRTSLSDPHRTDIPVLGEFAQVSYYSFQHRKVMRLTNQGVLEMLKLGKKAVDAATLVNRQYSKLQMQILTAISSLENVPKPAIKSK